MDSLIFLQMMHAFSIYCKRFVGDSLIVTISLGQCGTKLSSNFNNL